MDGNEGVGKVAPGDAEEIELKKLYRRHISDGKGGYYEYYGHLYRKIKRKILDAGRRRIQQAFEKLLFSEHC